jgi:hypothetical protein
MGAYYLLIAALGIAAVYLIYQGELATRLLLKYRGKMLVTCPETNCSAAVKFAAGRAALAALVGRKHIELSACSRWPEREDCGQDCMSQLAADPEGHRVWTIVSRWFAGRKCAYCRKPIEKLSHLDRRPALLGPDGKTIEWDKIPAEKITEILSTSVAACWSCHITETFRREHPDLVVDRPWKH